MSVVGENIKKAMDQASISQNQLAKKAGIAQATLSAIIRSTKSPSVDTIIRIASALDTKVSFLIGEYDSEIVYKTEEFTREELEVVKAYRDADAQRKSIICDILHVPFHQKDNMAL